MSTNTDMEEKVIEYFHSSIQAKMAVGESLAPEIAAAAKDITQQLLNGGKLLIAGFGTSRHLAEHFHYCLSHGLNFERPTLPTVLLSDTPSPFADPARLDSEVFSRQMTTLADSNDILLLISPGNDSEPLAQAVRVAYKRDLRCIVLTGPGDSLLTAGLKENDRELSAGTNNQFRSQEIQLLIIFCLCELIEQHLFQGSTPL